MLNSSDQLESRQLHKDSINPSVLKAQYAVRGLIPLKADELNKELQNPDNKLPFTQILRLNIGNPQALDQKPLTFVRQLLSVLEYPELAKQTQLFPGDVLRRAELLIQEIKSVGAYSDSIGIASIRQQVANFIRKRDGYESLHDHIHLVAGASAAVHKIMKTLASKQSDGVMIPIPQYPLYAATVALYGLVQVEYYLKESTNWSIDYQELYQIYAKASENGIYIRAICVINPGNPSGNVLEIAIMEQILRFCKEKKIVLIADEVYQTNVFDTVWVSFKKVLCDLQTKEPEAGWENLELFSLHSVSKGQLGECGHRGGYMELFNIDPEVEKEIHKLSSINLCAPVIGQACVSVLVNPPKENDESYKLYQEEINESKVQLFTTAKMLQKSFNEMENVTCNVSQGAMYLFPRFNFTQSFIKEAEQHENEPDEYYCLKLLEATGICVLPGSGFGQKKNEFHIRTTALKSDYKYLNIWKEFHKKIMLKYA